MEIKNCLDLFFFVNLLDLSTKQKNEVGSSSRVLRNSPHVFLVLLEMLGLAAGDV